MDRFYSMKLEFRIISALVLLLWVGTGEARAARERWTRVSSPNFLVAGDAPERDLRRAALKLEQFREVLARLFGKADLRTSASVRVLLLTPAKFDSVRPKAGGNPAALSGFFQPGADVHYIALTTSDPAADPWTIVLHEYVHLLLHENSRVVPLWFAEGLAEYFSTFEVLAGDRRVRIGDPINRHLATLKSGPLLPLEELFATTRDSAHYNEAEKQGLFYAESWALVHYLMLGRNQRRQPKVSHFIKDISDGAPAGDTFRGVFETNYADMLKELTRYLQVAEYPVQLVDFDQRLQSERDIKSGVLSEGQAQFYLGDVLLHTSRLAEAREYLARAVAADPSLADAHASMALVSASQGRQAEARAGADRAVQASPSNALFRYYRALIVTGAASGSRAVSSPDAAALAREDLAKAIELAPGFTEPYNLLAWLNLASGTEIEQSIELMTRALTFSPGRQELLLTLAQLNLRNGAWSAARDIVEPIVAAGANAELRTKAKEILQRVYEAAERQTGVPPGRASLEDRIAQQALGGGLAPQPEPEQVPDAAPSGLEEISGLLMEIVCKDKQMILVVQQGERRLNLASATPEDIAFTSYTPDVVAQVKCGPRVPPTPVRVRVRKKPAGETASDGEPVSVDFVQP